MTDQSSVSFPGQVPRCNWGLSSQSHNYSLPTCVHHISPGRQSNWFGTSTEGKSRWQKTKESQDGFCSRHWILRCKAAPVDLFPKGAFCSLLSFIGLLSLGEGFSIQLRSSIFLWTCSELAGFLADKDTIIRVFPCSSQLCYFLIYIVLTFWDYLYSSLSFLAILRAIFGKKQGDKFNK